MDPNQEPQHEEYHEPDIQAVEFVYQQSRHLNINMDDCKNALNANNGDIVYAIMDLTMLV